MTLSETLNNTPTPYEIGCSLPPAIKEENSRSFSISRIQSVASSVIEEIIEEEGQNRPGRQRGYTSTLSEEWAKAWMQKKSGEIPTPKMNSFIEEEPSPPLCSSTPRDFSISRPSATPRDPSTPLRSATLRDSSPPLIEKKTSKASCCSIA